MMWRALALATSLVAGLLLVGPAHAQKSVTPFIDEIREQTPEARPVPSGRPEQFIDSVRKDLKPVEEPSFIESLRKEDPAFYEKRRTDFIEQKKATIEPENRKGAIQAVQDGKSDLEMKRPGRITSALGFRVGTALSRTTTAQAGTGVRTFSDVYGTGWAPDLSVFYEYQPFHSEWFGNIGIVGMGGLAMFSGQGTFKNAAMRKPDGTLFDPKARTKFRFFQAPITLAIDYRFNLFRIVRPFALIGPTLIGYSENRDDGRDANKGYSRGLTTSFGASIPLDWLSSYTTWELYDQYRVKKFYLTVEYSRLTTFSGDVDFSTSGILAGMTFEL